MCTFFHHTHFASALCIHQLEREGEEVRGSLEDQVRGTWWVLKYARREKGGSLHGPRGVQGLEVGKVAELSTANVRVIGQWLMQVQTINWQLHFKV